MNYPWYKGIPRQGVQTACSELPEIQKSSLDVFMEGPVFKIQVLTKPSYVFKNS